MAKKSTIIKNFRLPKKEKGYIITADKKPCKRLFIVQKNKFQLFYKKGLD